MNTPKQAFDYLREECKKVGFDGCMIMLYSSDHSTKLANTALSQGFDCMGAYHYGTSGAKLDKHLAALESLKNETTIDRIPAVSVGFDNVGWGYSKTRNGLMDPANYPIITDYIKNEIVFEYDLITPCVDFFANNEFVFIICEGELLHFSIKLNRIVKYDIFSYALENLSLTTDKAIITLENGETIVIK